MTALKQTQGLQGVFSALSKSWRSFISLSRGSPELGGVEGSLHPIQHLKMVLGWSRKLCCQSLLNYSLALSVLADCHSLLSSCLHTVPLVLLSPCLTQTLILGFFSWQIMNKPQFVWNSSAINLYTSEDVYFYTTQLLRKHGDMLENSQATTGHCCQPVVIPWKKGHLGLEWHQEAEDTPVAVPAAHRSWFPQAVVLKYGTSRLTSL